MQAETPQSHSLTMVSVSLFTEPGNFINSLEGMGMCTVSAYHPPSALYLLSRLVLTDTFYSCICISILQMRKPKTTMTRQPSQGEAASVWEPL